MLCAFTMELYSESCPVSDLKADIILAGVFPLHVEVTVDHCIQQQCEYSYVKDRDGSKQCIKMNKAGVTWVEAMLYTIEKINQNPHILPGTKLGYIICDSYNDMDRALDIALKMTHLRRIHSVIPYCDSATASLNNCYSNTTKGITAVIGGASSKISSNLNYILGVNNIPQISYSSTSPALSNKIHYRSFLRTIPPDTYQGIALADIVNYFNWTYISTVATNDDYGRLGIESFKNAIKNRQICLSVEELFSIELSQLSTQQQINDIVSKLKKDEKATAIILFVEWPKAQAVLKEAAKQNLTGKTWIASEAWGNNGFALSIPDEIVGGMIGIIPSLGNINKLRERVNNIHPKNYSSNPWLEKYYNTQIKCLKDEFAANNRTMRENVVNITLDLTFNKCAYVMDAVNAVARAAHQTLNCNHTNNNEQRESNCEKNDKGKIDIDPEEILKALKTVNFVGALGISMRFDEHGEPPGEFFFLIANFRFKETGQVFIIYQSFEILNILQMLHTTSEWWVLRLKYKFKGLYNKITSLKKITFFLNLKRTKRDNIFKKNL